MENFNDIFSRAREASRTLLELTDSQRSAAITTLADLVETHRDELLAANSP